MKFSLFLPLVLSFFPSITTTSASLQELQVALSSLEFPRFPSSSLEFLRDPSSSLEFPRVPSSSLERNKSQRSVKICSSLFRVHSLTSFFLRALSCSTCLRIFCHFLQITTFLHINFSHEMYRVGNPENVGH